MVANRTYLAQDRFIEKGKTQVQAKIYAQVHIFRPRRNTILRSMLSRSNLRLRGRSWLLRLDIFSGLRHDLFLQEVVRDSGVVWIGLPVDAHNGLVRRWGGHLSGECAY